MAIEVSRKKKAVTSAGRCPPESGMVSLESARRGELNGIGFRSVRMAIEVSRVKKADTSAGRCPPESGRVSLESARRGGSNGIGFEASAWL